MLIGTLIETLIATVTNSSSTAVCASHRPLPCRRIMLRVKAADARMAAGTARGGQVVEMLEFDEADWV